MTKAEGIKATIVRRKAHLMIQSLHDKMSAYRRAAGAAVGRSAGPEYQALEDARRALVEAEDDVRELLLRGMGE